MIDFNDLTSFEFRVLVALHDSNSGRLKSHVPLDAILRQLTTEIKNNPKQIKRVRKIIKMLVATGLSIKHPTHGGTTYHITRAGKSIVEENQ